MSMSSGGGAEGDPMMDINTTPLIDVMLVLLIMFIITIPIQTHAVKLDLPPPNPNNDNQVEPDFNTIDIDLLGGVFWNGSEVSIPQLRGLLQQAAKMEIEPELRLHPDGAARYEVVDSVMAEAQQAGITKMGFVGNEAYAN